MFSKETYSRMIAGHAPFSFSIESLTQSTVRQFSVQLGRFEATGMRKPA